MAGWSGMSIFHYTWVTPLLWGLHWLPDGFGMESPLWLQTQLSEGPPSPCSSAHPVRWNKVISVQVSSVQECHLKVPRKQAFAIAAIMPWIWSVPSLLGFGEQIKPGFSSSRGGKYIMNLHVVVVTWLHILCFISYDGIFNSFGVDWCSCWSGYFMKFVVVSHLTMSGMDSVQMNSSEFWRSQGLGRMISNFKLMKQIVFYAAVFLNYWSKAF